MNKKNLMIGMILVSVLMISLVSAGVTGYVLKRGETIEGVTVSKIIPETNTVEIGGETLQKGETFTAPSGESFQITQVNKRPWFLGKESIEIVEVEEVWESVTCIFDDSTSLQQCNGKYADQSTSFSCEGIDSCTTKVHGSSGGEVLWRSGCEGEVWTVIDGNNDYAKFSCVEEVPCETITFTLGLSGSGTADAGDHVIYIDWNENGFWFVENGIAISDTNSWNMPLGNEFELTPIPGYTFTIVGIAEGEYVIVKICLQEVLVTGHTHLSDYEMRRFTFNSISEISQLPNLYNSVTLYNEPGFYSARLNHMELADNVVGNMISGKIVEAWVLCDEDQVVLGGGYRITGWDQGEDSLLQILEQGTYVHSDGVQGYRLYYFDPITDNNADGFDDYGPGNIEVIATCAKIEPTQHSFSQDN